MRRRVALRLVSWGLLLGLVAWGVWYFSSFSSACAANSQRTVSQERVSTKDGEREYLLYTPGVSRDVPLPLVLVFHGGGAPLGDARAMHEHSGWKEVADVECVVVAFAVGVPEDPSKPTQLNATLPNYNPLVWNTEPSDKLERELSYIRDIVEDVASRRSLDPARIFATGFSSGGAFSYLVGARLSETVAAIAPVEASFPNINGKSEHPVSLIRIQGIPSGVEPAPESYRPAQEWSSMLECTRTIDSKRVLVFLRNYSSCMGDASVVNVFVESMRHEYPGASAPFPVAQYIWDFFERNPKKSA